MAVIYTLTGTVAAIYEQAVLVQVGAIGFYVSVPQVAPFSVEKEVMMYTHFHWNQEQGPSLFGFLTPLDRDVFLLIISCSGIGPKIGLAAIGELTATGFVAAISNEDAKILSKVSGIGAKKAEQIIVQLKHKVAHLVKSGVDIGDDGASQSWHNIQDVLESLHYSRPEITSALQYLKKEYGQQTLSFDQLMRYALSFLAKKP